MTEWWQQVLRFTREGNDVSVATPWFRETYLPQSVIDGGDQGLFMAVESDLLGETTVRFAVSNGFAHYRVAKFLPELWDASRTYGFRSPVVRLRLSKARKNR